MSTPVRALRLPSSPFVVSVAHSRKFCAALSLLLTAFFALLALPAAQAHAQAVSGSVAVAPVIDTLAGDGTGGYNGDDIAATSAWLFDPSGAAVDSAGNLYIADFNNQRIRVVAAKTGTVLGINMTAGDIYTVAGNGTPGYNGDGILATSAELNSPQGVALDSAGNLYIADYGNNRIRVVAAKTGTVLGISVTAGDIYTVAGNGTKGYGGDGSPATSAKLFDPTGVAVDSAGNLYIADNGNQRVRVVAAATGTVFGVSATAGDIYTLAGNGTPGYNGDGILATSAELSGSYGVAMNSGNLYIADFGNQRVRVVAAKAGTIFGQSMTALDIYTVAGNGAQGYNGDGILATSAGLNNPTGMALDSAGSLYIADCGDQRIRMVAAATGTVLGRSVTADDIYTVAGDGKGGYSGDGSAATSAELDTPEGVAVDSADNLYIADTVNNRIRKVNTNTTTVPTTAVGASAAPQNVLVELTAASAISSISVPKAQNNMQEFTVGAVTGCTVGGVSNPIDTICTVPITFDPQYPGPRAGELTLYSSGTTILGTVGLTGNATGPLVGFQPGTQTVVPATGLKDPYEVAVDGAGDLYIADTGNNRVVEVTPGGVQTTVGTGLNAPSGVAVDAAGNVYIANNASSNVVEVTPEGAQTTLTISVGGTGLVDPQGVAVDSAGNLYIADQGNNRVVKVTLEGAQTTVGTGLSNPYGVAVDAAGNVYIADSNNNRVVEVPANGGAQTTVGTGLNFPESVAVDAAGNVYVANTVNNHVVEVPANGGVQTTVGTGLSNPYGVAVDAAGNVYIADSNNNRVVEVNQSQQSLSFPNTVVGSTSSTQTVTMRNIGNQTLNILSLSATTDFPLEPTSNCTVTPSSGQTLAVGGFCDLDYAFQPTTTGTLNESATLTDNNLNVTNAKQTISFTGTGTTATPASIAVSSGSGQSAVVNTAFANPLVVIVKDASGNPVSGATVTFTAGTGIKVSSSTATTNSSGLAQVTATPTTASTSLTVTANVTGVSTPASFTETGTTATPPPSSFTVAANPNTMTIAPPATGSTVLTLATTTYNGTVTLSCSGLPANAYCSFPGNAGAQSQVVTLSGSNMSVNLNIETSVATAPPLTLMQAMPSPFGPDYSPVNPSSPLSPILPALAFWWPGSMAGLAAFGRRKNLSKTRQRMLQLCLLVLMTGALAAGISGCGGSSSSTPAATHITPAGTSTVTVTATPASGTAQTTTITLTIS